MQKAHGSIPQDTLPIGDPSGLAGNTDTPFEEEAHLAKVAFLETILQSQTETNLAAKRTVLIDAVGGQREAERINVWEAVRKEGATSAFREAQAQLSKTEGTWRKPEAERDIFGTVALHVAQDMLGVMVDSHSRVKAPDVTGFNTGSELFDIATSPVLEDAATLTTATETIRLLVTYGRYKLNKWGSGEQLKTALDLMKTYTDLVPDFNPIEAGFFEASQDLTFGLAALQVDDNTKGNYRYVYPERSYLIGAMQDGLKTLRETEAHVFLWNNDIEIPPEVPDK